YTLARPPCPPLLPYTTLFRSRLDRAHPVPQHRARVDVPGGHHEERPRRRADPVAGGPARHHARCDLRARFLRPRALLERRRVPTDRKSTRLNSSHVSISYAVF